MSLLLLFPKMKFKERKESRVPRVVPCCKFPTLGLSFNPWGSASIWKGASVSCRNPPLGWAGSASCVSTMAWCFSLPDWLELRCILYLATGLCGWGGHRPFAMPDPEAGPVALIQSVPLPIFLGLGGDTWTLPHHITRYRNCLEEEDNPEFQT